MKNIRFTVLNILFALFIVLGMMFLFGCGPEKKKQSTLDSLIADLGGVEKFVLPMEHDLANIPADPKNKLTPEKVALGKLLFHDPRLTAPKEEGTPGISCATCHDARAGFGAGVAQSMGEGGMGLLENRKKDPAYNGKEPDFPPIKSPTALVSAYNEVMLWNGSLGNPHNEGFPQKEFPAKWNKLGYTAVETQAFVALEAHRQQGDDLGKDPIYTYLFISSFGDKKMTRDREARALAAYERTLLPTQAPWQRYLRGDRTALTRVEREGAVVFLKECSSCHSGPGLTDSSFHKLDFPDLNPDKPQKGRGGYTDEELLMGHFKTPTLYNIKDNRPYGHGGNFVTLSSVISAHPQVRALNEKDMDALLSFVRDALTDPNLDRYVPEYIPGKHCFPSEDIETCPTGSSHSH